jgi:hypothetical protein
MLKAVEQRRSQLSPEVLEQMQKLGRMISAETDGGTRPSSEIDLECDRGAGP